MTPGLLLRSDCSKIFLASVFPVIHSSFIESCLALPHGDPEPCLNLKLVIVVTRMCFGSRCCWVWLQLSYFLGMCFIPGIIVLHYQGGCANQIRVCRCAVDLHSTLPPFLPTQHSQVYSSHLLPRVSISGWSIIRTLKWLSQKPCN